VAVIEPAEGPIVTVRPCDSKHIRAVEVQAGVFVQNLARVAVRDAECVAVIAVTLIAERIIAVMLHQIAVPVGHNLR